MALDETTGRWLSRLRYATWDGVHWADVALGAGVSLFPLISAYKIWSNADGLLKYICAVVVIGMVARGSARPELERILARLRTPLGLALLLAMAYAATSAFRAADAGRAFEDALTAAGAVAAAIVVGTRLAIVSDERTQALFAVTTCIGLVLLLVDAAAGFPVFTYIHGKPVQALVNPNVMALTMLTWPAIGTFVLRGKTFLALAIWLIAGAIVAISTSGAGQLAYAAGTAILVLALWSMTLAVWASVAIGIGGLLLAPFAGRAAVAAAAILPAQWVAGAHVGDRAEIWSAFALEVERAPLFGAGFGSAGRPDDPVMSHPHNAALQIWVEFGAAGVLLTAACLVLLGIALLRSPSPRKPFVLACAVSIYASAYVSFGLWEPQWLGIVLLVAIVAVSALAVRSSEAR